MSNLDLLITFSPSDIPKLLSLVGSPQEQVFWETPLASKIIKWLNPTFTDAAYATLIQTPDARPFPWLLRAHLEHELEPGAIFTPLSAVEILESAATHQDLTSDDIATWFIDICEFIAEKHLDLGDLLITAATMVNLFEILSRLSPARGKVIDAIWPLASNCERSFGLACYFDSPAALYHWLEYAFFNHSGEDLARLGTIFYSHVNPNDSQHYLRLALSYSRDFAKLFLTTMERQGHRETLRLLFGEEY